MAGRGRMNQEGDQIQVVLGLEAQPSVVLGLEAQPPTSRHQTTRRRASVPKPSRFIPGNINVHAGEDIIARIRAYFECRDIRPNMQASYLYGHVLSARGEVSNPRLLQQGSPIVFEGIHAIGSFNGWYAVLHDGSVELDNLKITIHGSDGQCIGGDVTGPLVAATDVKVLVSWNGYVDEE